MPFKNIQESWVKRIEENMRNESEVLKAGREEYFRKLIQAPYKPKGMVLSTILRVLALSCGTGDPSRGDPIYWAGSRKAAELWRMANSGVSPEMNVSARNFRSSFSVASLMSLVQGRRKS